MEFTRLFDIPYYQVKKNPLLKVVGNKVNGSWTYYTARDFIEKVNQVSLGLLALGVKPGDKIALISTTNRPEWNIMDIGIMQIGAINVPVYPTISPGEYEYIFNDAGIKLCFLSDEPLFKKVNSIKAKVSTLEGIYSFDKIKDVPYWESILKTGDLSEVEEIKKQIKPDELATIIYTSGTTGNPKGVMLSHTNIVSNIKDVLPMVPLSPGQMALSFLPLCHIFERTVTYTYLALGISISYADGIESIGENLQEVKPHFFTTVPRLLEKVYEKIYKKGLALTGAKKKLFFWALSLTDDYEYDKAYTGLDKIKRTVADKLIFSKWREALGGNIRGILTGAAPCPLKMAKIFSAAGIPIREGYGLTETSPALCVSGYEPGMAKLGTVGPPLPSVELKIAEDGEILAKGPNIMLGYYNKPEATAEVINSEGWFHTGDIGTLIDSGRGHKFLKITDRKKELLKTSGGKYVAPAPIESKFKGDFMIEQMMVVGNNEKFVSALITPSVPALQDWCSVNSIQFTSLEEVVKNPKVLQKYQEIIDSYNPEFSHIEQIKKFTLLPKEWSIDTLELTPTMKLKRRVILEKFATEIDKMYDR